MGLAGYRVAHRRFVSEALQSIADALGVTVPRPDMPHLTASARTTTFDEALREIDSLAAMLHGEQRLHARSAGTTIRHLRADDMVGAELGAATEQELIEVFGTTDEKEICVKASTGGAAGDVAMLRCLARRAIRHEWLWSAAIEPAPDPVHEPTLDETIGAAAADTTGGQR